MKINKKLAKGIHIVEDDFEFIRAERKPNAQTKIIREVWVSTTVKKLKEKNENKN